MMAPIVPVIYSNSDSDSWNAAQSATNVSEVLKDYGYNSYPLRLIDISLDRLQEAEFIFPCDSIPYPKWISLPDHLKLVGLKAYLEINNFHFIGSGVKSVALAKDKLQSKRLFVSKSIKTPEWKLLSESGISELKFPVIIKPRVGSTSRGVRYVKSLDELLYIRQKMSFYEQEGIIVENYISGDEVTVGVIEDGDKVKVLKPIQIKLDEKILDFQAKIHPPFPKYEKYNPPKKSILEEIYLTVSEAFKHLGCNDYGRIDLRVDNDGTPWVLEVNTAPRLSKIDYMSIAAKMSEINYNDFILKIINSGLRRKLNNRIY